MTRQLRPGRILSGGGVAWLVDESWPVVQAIGDDGSTSLLTWPWAQHRTDSAMDRVTVADGAGLVVSDGGQVSWVRQDGTTSIAVQHDWSLAAADPDAAWFVDCPHIDPGQSPVPPPPGRIHAVHRDGTYTSMDTPAPVMAIDIDGPDMWVTVAERSLGTRRGPNAWHFHHPGSALRVPIANVLTKGLAEALPVSGDRPARVRHRPSAWTWLQEDPDTVVRYGERAAGLAWWAGTPNDGNKIERRVVVVGSDASTGEPRFRVDAGPGLVQDIQGVGDELWVVVARRRYLAVPQDRGVDVLAISASGAVRTVHSANSVDISMFAPVLNRPPQKQIDEHIAEVRDQFDGFDAHSLSEDGTLSPRSVEPSDSSLSLEGEWPDARLIVILRHTSRPGLLLRRTLPLFDATGAPIRHQGWRLKEDVDTNYLAPAEEAVDGVLDT